MRANAKQAPKDVVHVPQEALAKAHLPDDPSCAGVFVVIVRRAPGNVWDVEHTADGRIRRIKRPGRPRPDQRLNAGVRSNAPDHGLVTM